MRRRNSPAALAVLALLMLGNAGAYAADDVLERQLAVDALFADIDRPESPGAAVAIRQGDVTLYSEGYGMANLEHGTPVTRDTVFHVASVSKQFAAFAVALLAYEGALALDDDVRKHLPWVPDFGKTITVRHLVYHTSGLRDQWGLFKLGGQAMENRLMQQQVINMVARQRDLNFAPGSAHMYSNTGYTLLAEIVESVTGKSLREYCDERLFAPLAMRNSFFFDDLTEIVPGRADSYLRRGDGRPVGAEGWRRDPLNYENVGATSLFSTVGDLLKWTRNFRTADIGGKAFMQRFLAPGTLDDGAPINYGFGLTEIWYAGHRSIGHSGKDAGFVSLLAWFPEQDFSVALVANTPLDLAERMSDIVRIYLGEGDAPASAQEPAVAASDDPRNESLPGTYVALHGRLVQIVNGSDGLEWHEGDRVDPIILRSDGSFDREDRRWWSWYRPTRSVDGRIVAFDESNYRGGRSGFERRDQRQPDESALYDFVGDYYSPELDVTYRYAVNQGELTAESLWATDVTRFTPSSRDRFDSTDRSIGTVQFLRDANGKVQAALVHNGRIRDIRFKRLAQTDRNYAD